MVSIKTLTDRTVKAYEKATRATDRAAVEWACGAVTKAVKADRAAAEAWEAYGRAKRTEREARRATPR